MNFLFKLIILLAVAILAYLYIVPGASVEDFKKHLPSSSSSSAPKIDPVTGRPLIPCVPCAGTGRIKCSILRCKAGKVECDGPCLKLSKGIWIRNDKLSPDKDKLWITFPQRRGAHYFSDAYLGYVIVMRDGMAINTGPCQECDATTLVPCKVCRGKGSLICPDCKGEKLVPDMRPRPPKAASGETPPNQPPETVRLKDGKTVVGYIAVRDPKFLIVRKEDGQTIQIFTKDLARP